MKKFIFPDASIFLYFQPLDQVDLAQVFECDEIELVVAPAVLEELERQGWDHPQLSMRKRAEYSLRKIRAWMQQSSGLIRPNVEVTLCQGPKQTTFHEHHLDAGNRDDLIIANVLEHTQIHGNEAVVLLTHDVRRQLKAHRHGLRSVSLPAEILLPQARAAAQEAGAEVRSEPARGAGRIPRVELRFANGSRMLYVKQKEEELHTSDLIATRLDELRMWCREPLRFREIKVAAGLDEREAASMLLSAMLIPRPEFERYERELDAFLQACEDWLQRRAEVMDSIRATVRLDFELVNTGRVLAEGLVLTLTLPKKLRWRESLADDEALKQPQPPSPPRSHMEIVHEAVSDLYRATVPPLAAGLEPADVPTADGWLVEGQELRGLVDACPQHRAVKLPPIYAAFIDPEAVSTFAISYVVNERNMPEPLDGKLLVRIS
jgi:hypothetical protein